MSKKYVVYIAFLKYDDEGSLYEKILLYGTSCFLNGKTGGILHVEIIVPDGKNRYAYFSSSKKDEETGGDGVRKRKINDFSDEEGRCKYLERAGYSNFLELKLTESQHDKIWKFLDDQVGKPFDTKAWYVNYLPLIKNCIGNIDNKGECYTCSALVWKSLQEIDYVDNNYEYYSITPQQIYDVLTTNEFLIKEEKIKEVNVADVVNRFGNGNIVLKN